MKAAFEEIGRMSATFAVTGGESGQVCKITANGTVCPCADGDKFCGVLEGIRGGFAGVQLEGFAELKYSGTAPALGYVNLCANGTGGVKTGSGNAYLAVSVDTANKTVTIKL